MSVFSIGHVCEIRDNRFQVLSLYYIYCKMLTKMIIDFFHIFGNFVARSVFCGGAYMSRIQGTGSSFTSVLYQISTRDRSLSSLCKRSAYIIRRKKSSIITKIKTENKMHIYLCSCICHRGSYIVLPI